MRIPDDKAFDLVGIGVSVWDCILLVDNFPQQSAVTQARKRYEGIGGGVAVATATAARLGSRTAMIDSLGDDAAGKSIVQTLRREGVDTNSIQHVDGQSTSIASIWADVESTERTIVFSPGSASTNLQWNSSVERIASDAKVLHLNGRHPMVCHSAIEVAKANGALVSFDGGAHRYRQEIVPVLEKSDIVVVAKQFAESHHQAQGKVPELHRLEELTEFLLADLHCQIAGVTDGVNGSFLMDRTGQCIFQPAIQPDLAIDTTGCGDTYHGAFLHAIANAMDLKEAAELAAEVSSRNARDLGAFAFKL